MEITEEKANAFTLSEGELMKQNKNQKPRGKKTQKPSAIAGITRFKHLYRAHKPEPVALKSKRSLMKANNYSKKGLNELKV